ncbi:hypothetical protein A2118_04005 [Candidatus Kaiserbacteria bacterium GWA2_50_9]|uniref:Uncharacterized protein n=1 Tax=Candidatus Kaiserbacteria bacterium GWA2_50_9 TaxID=1798474 RepID=A0A1F6BUP4_9BACT|nr:MAG: hypothetical protein A2118_04005 [Candidatus Kaiserbacteria bacterium GWA2_50_9]
MMKYKRLDWEYCEYGCKGYAISFGTVHYWLFWDIHEDGKYHLYKGHGFTLSDPIGSYDSFDDADHATREHVRPLFGDTGAQR